MNRVLYQLSYAAIGHNFGTAEISFVIIYSRSQFVKGFIRIFPHFFENTPQEVIFLHRKNLPFLFAIGGLGYMGLELLWRRRTHGSMFFAGGSCFLLLGRIQRRFSSLPARAIAGSAAITGVELLTGVLVNRKHHIWDYRNMPMNLRGQICLPYSLLWIPVSLLGGRLYRLLDTTKARQLG